MESHAIWSRIDQLEKLALSQAKEIETLKKLIQQLLHNNAANNHIIFSNSSHQLPNAAHLNFQQNNSTTVVNNNRSPSSNRNSLRMQANYTNKDELSAAKFQPYPMNSFVHPITAIPPISSPANISTPPSVDGINRINNRRSVFLSNGSPPQKEARWSSTIPTSLRLRALEDGKQLSQRVASKTGNELLDVEDDIYDRRDSSESDKNPGRQSLVEITEANNPATTPSHCGTEKAPNVEECNDAVYITFKRVNGKIAALPKSEGSKKIVNPWFPSQEFRSENFDDGASTSLLPEGLQKLLQKSPFQ